MQKSKLLSLNLIILAAAFTQTISMAASPNPKSKPNIIVYMVDDLGWNHISASQVTMGTSKKVYHTPNIDKLADNGLSFTHAYAQPNCAPTRAAMLSGQYPARVHNNVYCVGSLNRYGKGGKNGISKKNARFLGAQQTEDVAAEAITVAESLKRNGYATAHIGKYHVGGHSGPETLPENAGFDINIGGFTQGHQPVCFASQINGQWKFRGLGRGNFDKYATPYTEDYVKAMNLPKSLIGTPKHVSDAMADALKETVKKLNDTGIPFYLQFHSYAVHGPVKPRPDLKQKAVERLGKNAGDKMLNYVSFISSVDENLGRMLEIIEDPDGNGDTSDSISDNTLVLFTSDNGGTHADNEPLKGVKGQFTEGGIRVPLIAYWKGVIPANKITNHRVHSVDYYPTYLQLAGNKWQPPENIHPLDGKSFADVLLKPEVKRPSKPVYYLFPGYMDWRGQPCVVTIDDINNKTYKLYYFYETDSHELYCITDDQSEKKNIIKARPDIAAALSKNIDKWLNLDHITWQPQYPIDKQTGKPAGPPPLFTTQKIK